MIRAARASVVSSHLATSPNGTASTAMMTSIAFMLNCGRLGMACSHQKPPFTLPPGRSRTNIVGVLIGCFLSLVGWKMVGWFLCSCRMDCGFRGRIRGRLQKATVQPALHLAECDRHCGSLWGLENVRDTSAVCPRSVSLHYLGNSAHEGAVRSLANRRGPQQTRSHQHSP